MTRADWYDVAFIAAIFAVVLGVCAVFGCPKCEAAEPQSPRMLVYFTAEWCGPCHQMQPVLKELRSDGYKIHSINVDALGALGTGYKTGNIPATVCFERRRGKWVEVGRVVGVAPIEKVRGLIERSLVVKRK